MNLVSLAQSIFTKGSAPSLQPVAKVTVVEREYYRCFDLCPHQGLIGLISQSELDGKFTIHLSSQNFELLIPIHASPLPQSSSSYAPTNSTTLTTSTLAENELTEFKRTIIHTMTIKESYLIASSCETVYIFDLSSKTPLNPEALQTLAIPPCSSRVNFVYWLNATWVYLGQEDGSLVLWNSNEKTISSESYNVPFPEIKKQGLKGRDESIVIPPEPVRCLSLHPVMMDVFLIGYKSFAILWNSKDSCILSVFQVQSMSLNCFTWNEDGSALILSFGHDFYIYFGLSNSQGSKTKSWFKKKPHSLLATLTVAPGDGDHKESNTRKMIWIGRNLYILDLYYQGVSNLFLTQDNSRIESQTTIGKNLDVLDMTIIGDEIFLLTEHNVHSFALNKNTRKSILPVSLYMASLPAHKLKPILSIVSENIIFSMGQTVHPSNLLNGGSVGYSSPSPTIMTTMHSNNQICIWHMDKQIKYLGSIHIAGKLNDISLHSVSWSSYEMIVIAGSNVYIFTPKDYLKSPAELRLKSTTAEHQLGLNNSDKLDALFEELEISVGQSQIDLAKNSLPAPVEMYKEPLSVEKRSFNPLNESCLNQSLEGISVQTYQPSFDSSSPSAQSAKNSDCLSLKVQFVHDVKVMYCAISTRNDRIVTVLQGGIILFYQLSTCVMLSVHDFAKSGMTESTQSLCCYHYNEYLKCLHIGSVAGSVYSCSEHMGSFVTLQFKNTLSKMQGLNPFFIQEIPFHARPTEKWMSVIVTPDCIRVFSDATDIVSPVFLPTKLGFFGKAQLASCLGQEGIMALTSQGVLHFYNYQLSLQWELNIMKQLNLKSLSGVDFAKNGHVLVYDGYQVRSYSLGNADSKVNGTDLRIYSRQREPSSTRLMNRGSRRSNVKHQSSRAPIMVGGSSISDGSNSDNQLMMGLQERGEKLEHIEKQSAQLEESSSLFLANVQKLKQAVAQKKWFEF